MHEATSPPPPHSKRAPAARHPTSASASVVGEIVQDRNQRFDILDFVGLGRVLSLSIVIAVIDVILITAIATLAAFLYNVSSALVGGLQLTLTDD